MRNGESGIVLLEVLLLAPILLLIGFLAIEYASLAVHSSEISAEIRGIVNRESLDIADEKQFSQRLEQQLAKKISEITFIDQARLPQISIKALDESLDSRVDFPFLDFDGESNSVNSPKSYQVRVVIFSRSFFSNFINLPSHEELVSVRLRQ
jgi:hypothetical protein